MAVDVKYRTGATVTGGREGHAKVHDGDLALTLSTPTADGGAGTGAIAGSPASLTVTDDDVAGYLVDTSATAATISERDASRHRLVAPVELEAEQHSGRLRR